MFRFAQHDTSIILSASEESTFSMKRGTPHANDNTSS